MFYCPCFSKKQKYNKNNKTKHKGLQMLFSFTQNIKQLLFAYLMERDKFTKVFFG